MKPALCNGDGDEGREAGSSTAGEKGRDFQCGAFPAKLMGTPCAYIALISPFNNIRSAGNYITRRCLGFAGFVEERLMCLQDLLSLRD